MVTSGHENISQTLHVCHIYIGWLTWGQMYIYNIIYSINIPVPDTSVPGSTWLAGRMDDRRSTNGGPDPDYNHPVRECMCLGVPM